MTASQTAALWIIAVGVLGAVLFFLREPLTQFALALILWLAIDGFAEAIDARLKGVPRFLSLPIAFVLILGVGAVVVYVLATNIGSMLAHAQGYQIRLNQVAAQIHAAVGGAGPAPTVGELLARADPSTLGAELAQGLQGFASNVVFILIFLGFIFSGAALMPRKLDRIFIGAEAREGARKVFASIRTSMESYLLVQTVLSIITTALTYVCLELVGLDNALFWSFLIFFLNYIPTIGSIIAVVLPTLFALVQFPTIGPVIGVAASVGVWQFVIGNFLAPRMTGDSLNLSAVVVLLALAIWSTIWGIAGAFLAAPLTVMLMIVLAQFPSTRWIAILLSNDGKPARVSRVKKESESG
ncbi:hypothetical protein U91I_00364 [alpha proteobacterium U9-1i]|nr:hypothetical protein U91I_00364 [alpha proteobacterium U9-1i]